MSLKFYKYQGTGNDFVMIDNRDFSFDRQNETLIAQICHRRFGVGADGLILLQNKEGFDFEMVYFNANGREGSMCGNGGRCTVKFAQFLGLFEFQTRFWAVDGEHLAEVKDDQVSLKMQDVKGIEIQSDDYFLNTGSPHYVAFRSNLDSLDVVAEGKTIRYNDRFRAEGTNVNFVEMLGNQTLFVRTYERGVEDETYSCGTGVTACALATSLKGWQSPVEIKTIGGTLRVSFEQINADEFTHIYLSGPAKQVFEGIITE